MATAVATWGNSAAVRIPRGVLARANLRHGDKVSLQLNERGHIEIVPEDRPHRHVIPAAGVSFDGLFAGWSGDRQDAGGTAWPSDDLVGAEWNAWRS